MNIKEFKTKLEFIKHSLEHGQFFSEKMIQQYTSKPLFLYKNKYLLLKENIEGLNVIRICIINNDNNRTEYLSNKTKKGYLNFKTTKEALQAIDNNLLILPYSEEERI